MFCCKRFYVRDGALVADLRDSLTPMIWRMELSRVHAVGFKVRQNDQVWELGVEGANSAFSPIASYATQDAANKALGAIGCGLRRQGMARRLAQTLWMLLLLSIAAYVIYNVGSYVFSSGMPAALHAGSGMPAQPLNQPLGQSLPADQALRAPAP